ncbi:MAG: hypothetical protein QOD77_1240 [Thermoplasmata archaeon]|jgi:hypothetical protein|nr:hypothetical protein [Thermoplasmata archaeon]
MRVVPLVLLAVLAVAGCTQSPPAADPPAQDHSGSLAERLAAEVPPISWDVAAQVDWWADVATNYPKHDSNLPANTELRERLVADLEALGLEVEVRAYPGAAQGVVLPDADGARLYAIIATKQGTTMPDHRIGLVSHYDTEALTVHGAYDDASGVAAEYSICKALAAVPMNRTLACIFFDGEERGLAASEAYVQDVVVENDEGYAYDFVLGYDMTGINWPGHAWKMYVMVGEPHVDPLYAFTQDLMHKALGYPEDGVEVLDVHDRNSDERNFKEAGVPILRFAGGRRAADYDQYHMPLDTVDHVYQVTQGRENFEKGFATIVEASYVTALVLDQTSLDAMAA